MLIEWDSENSSMNTCLAKQDLWDRKSYIHGLALEVVLEVFSVQDCNRPSALIARLYECFEYTRAVYVLVQLLSVTNKSVSILNAGLL